MVFLAGCSSVPEAPRDPVKEAWYGETLGQLAPLVRDADAAFANHKPDDAAALIEKAEPLAKRVVSVPHPTLAAAQAASDLDDLYGRMLLSNRHYGYARLLFQKNLARWKYWQPRTEDSARRFKQAQDAIAECDRHIVQ
jgi:DNA-binding transcriptional LysR family regulator